MKLGCIAPDEPFPCYFCKQPGDRKIAYSDSSWLGDGYFPLCSSCLAKLKECLSHG